MMPPALGGKVREDNDNEGAAGRVAAMTGYNPTWLGQADRRAGSEKEALNRALVAGLMLEVILAQPALPEDPEGRRGQVKARLKAALVTRLAGHIPLNSFRDLAQNLDQWFDFFYPLLTPQCSLSRTCGDRGTIFPGTSGQALREDLLLDCLEHMNGLLPKRRHRKLDRPRLLVFLRRTGGGWFRLKDFEQFFHIDRKTAWEYIQKFLQAGLLDHNQGRSAAVRYRLTLRFSGQ
jgi:hypothetical protein